MKQNKKYFNKQLLILIGFLGLLGFILGNILAKYLPFLFKTPVYYCQHFLCSTLLKASGSLGVVLFNLLIVTIVFTLAKTFIDFWKISKIRKDLKPVLKYPRKVSLVNKEIGLAQRQVTVVDHFQPFAFCFGFLKPKIIISRELVGQLEKDELRAVLYHEKYHLEHYDGLTMYLTRLLQSLFPFFPLFNDQVRHLSWEREVKADQEAITSMGEKKPLINALKKLISVNTIGAYQTFPGFIDAERNMEIRIKALTGRVYAKNLYTRKNLWVSISSLVILLGMVYLPISTVSLTAQAGDEQVVACVDSEACAEACRNEHAVTDNLYRQLHP